LFQNTNIFYEHPRLIYLPINMDFQYNAKFINTCDAMVYAKADDENFDLPYKDIFPKNKPIITRIGLNTNYCVFGDCVVYYTNPRELYKIIKNLIVVEHTPKNDEWFK